MASRKMEFFIGMMVIGIIAGVFVMSLLFGSNGGVFIGGNAGRRMTILLDKSSGINQNSLVYKSGIQVGRVYSVELEDQMGSSQVRILFELEPGYKIYSNEYAKINRTLLGEASIEFADNPKYDAAVDGEIRELTPDDVIHGENSSDLVNTMSNIEGDLTQTLQNLNAAAQGVSQFMANLNSIIGDEKELELKKERIRTLFDEVNGTFADVHDLIQNLNAIAGDQDVATSLRETALKAPKIMEKVDSLAAKADNFMLDAKGAADDMRITLARAGQTFDLVDKNLDNVSVFTDSLAEDGPKMMQALNASAGDIRTAIDGIRGAVENISELAQKLNEKIDDPDSPVGMLADEEIGRSLRNIVFNAEDLSEKLYPILDDARVFTNKIAHKPSSLLWDRNASKGALLCGNNAKYGNQNQTPTGGISSPLFRLTPSGAKIRSRNYYEPGADVDYMDPTTRAAYEDALARRQYGAITPEMGQRTRTPGAGCWAWEKRASRANCRLGCFWDRLTSKRADAKQGNGTRFVSYDARSCLGSNVGQPIYSDYVDDGLGAVYAGYDRLNVGASPFVAPCEELQTCSVPSCETPSCETPSCETPTYEASTCETDSCAPGCDGQNAGAGSSQRLGAYASDAPQALGFGGNPQEEPTQMQSLTSSVADSNQFEDDGATFEFAPPTR